MKLNNSQMLQVELFELYPMSEKQLSEFRDVILEYLGKEMDVVISQAMQERGVTAEDIERSTAAINENRTDYRQKFSLSKT